MKSYSKAYKDAGVDITAGYKAVELMKKHIDLTKTDGVIGSVGGFAGLFKPNIENIKTPLLVASTDGVGTKLKLAFLTDRHDTIGIDCVAMCVNDIICCGAKPLFFLDYLAVGSNNPEKVAEIVSGVAKGCVEASCALIGGETAEMPGFYKKDEYDLAGFSIGMVDEEKIINNDNIKPGDVLIGIASSGLHSNGYSLVRRILNIDDMSQKELNKIVPELGESLADNLIRPTKIYVKAIQALVESLPVNGICNITGGGFYENIPRMLPKGTLALIEKDSLPVLPVFRYLEKTGNLDEHDMYNVFNMGIGMVVSVSADYADRAVKVLTESGETAVIIGRVEKDKSDNKGVILC